MKPTWMTYQGVPKGELPPEIAAKATKRLVFQWGGNWMQCDNAEDMYPGTSRNVPDVICPIDGFVQEKPWWKD